MNPLLTIENLHIHFNTPSGPVYAVNGIDLQLTAGDTLALVGESGCGKSVTSLALMGLLGPSAAVSAGKITFEGLSLLDLAEHEFRRLRGPRMAMVFQDPMSSLNPVLTIGRQLTEALLIHGLVSPAEADLRALDLLTAVGIPAPEARLHQYPHQCSGGMRQRIMLAIALSCSPALLIADEPTTALDVTVQANILRLLARHTAGRQTTLLMISHDLAVVAGACQRIAVMYGGLIMETAPTDVLFSQPTHPYTLALLASRPRLDCSRLATIPGQPPNLRQPPTTCPFLPRCPRAMQVCRQLPPLFSPSDSHQVRCWLQHPAVSTPSANQEVSYP